MNDNELNGCSNFKEKHEFTESGNGYILPSDKKIDFSKYGNELKIGTPY